MMPAVLNLSSAFEVSFKGRKLGEQGPERNIVAISIANSKIDAIDDISRRFDVWLIQSVVQK